ncbi:ATP-binding cassette domain-containing protein [Streptomyces sp. NPDC004435]|uniref:ATP-binding cassette domain-containing protein n=1 Tax=Streptomyces sp. NPDC004435 TaxID=3364701 RepID=UPI0036A05835
MIEANELTKRYGRVTAVDRLSFTVRPGRVTGFLGPNGAGKSTTLRMVLGLATPSSGGVVVDGTPFRHLPRGLRHVGALLDAHEVHGGRTARAHLSALARGNGLSARRVDEVLGAVGLSSAAGRRIGGFSLGMKQRLGIATALLGDPPVLLFDEPLNGLDPEGVRWVRGLFRTLAGEGRVVLVSSHLMGEMEHTADDLIVVGRGRLVAAEPLAVFAGRGGGTSVAVRTPDPSALADALRGEPGAALRGEDDGGWTVTGATAERVGDLAHRHGIRLHGLTSRTASLEEVFLDLTADRVEFSASVPDGPRNPGPEDRAAPPPSPLPEPAREESVR